MKTTRQKNTTVETSAVQRTDTEKTALRNTALCGLAILIGFLSLFFISEPFEYGSEQPRPVLAVVALLITMAVLAFVGLGFALQVPPAQRRKLLGIVFGLAISIRLVAIFTPPILEIDYYRYIWDGKVAGEGVSPYRFSPAQVLASGEALDQDLNRLRALSTRSQSNHATLSRIHYEEYTTVYPPVSQFVFAAAMKLIPESASIETHIIGMKFTMTLFDLGTLLLLGWLLKMACLHQGWLIAYAWNPLVIKEIANSGHLDSVASCLVVLTLCLVARQRFFPTVRFSQWQVGLAGVTLGLGVGAKLFPVVLFPALLVAIVGNSDQRRSIQDGKRWFAGVSFSTAFALTACIVLFPLWNKHFRHAGENSSTQNNITPPAVAEGASSTKSRDGFDGFFSSWRMNDPVFSTVYFNLKSDTEDSKLPWFVFTTKRWRSQLDAQVQGRGVEGKDPAYFLARVLTMSLFSVCYVWHLVKLYQMELDDEQWVVDLTRRIVMVLTIFLFLQPTVNPWYFVWVAPLTCLTNNRGWLLASSILTLYYARFWFKGLAGTFVFFGQTFKGAKLFDHGFVFVEFGLIIALLISFSFGKQQSKTSSKK